MQSAIKFVMLAAIAGAAWRWAIEIQDAAAAPDAVAPASVAVAGQASAPDTAHRLVHEAAERLEAYASISCRMRCRGEVFGDRILGNGEYRQAAVASRRLRWDTKLRVGDSIVSVQQIADGNYLWINLRQQQSVTLSRVDIARVDAAEHQARKSATVRPLGKLGLTHVGGLPKLVRSLDRAFRFSGLSTTQLGETPVFTVRGTWTPAMLATLAPEQQAALKAGTPINWSKVPEHVPDQVVLALGRNDYFPYRIEYRRTCDDRTKVLLMIELYDVQCNVPLEKTLFAYQPGDAPIIDITEQVIANRLTH